MALLTSKKQEKTTSKESWVNNISQPYASNEIRSGFLVIVSALVLLGMLLMSGKSGFFGQTRTVKISFNYIGGLEKNSPVHFAGHKVGKVTGIDFNPDGPSLLTVTAAVSPDIILRADSQAYVDALGFMGEKYVELTPGAPGAAALEADQTLKGTDPMPMMELVKRGTELLSEFEKTNKSMNSLMADMKKLLDGNKENLDGIFTNLNSSSSNLNDMTKNLKYHPWKILRKGKEFSAEEIEEMENSTKHLTEKKKD